MNDEMTDEQALAMGKELLGKAKKEAIKRAALKAYNEYFFKCTPSCSVETWTAAWEKAIKFWTEPPK